MAGTEDYTFYYSLENSPFWIKKAGSEESDGNDLIRVKSWEDKLKTSRKYECGIWIRFCNMIMFFLMSTIISF